MNKLTQAKKEVGATFLMFQIFEGNPKAATKMSKAINKYIDLLEQEKEEGIEL